MNFDLLSKNAVSYSSASITKYSLSVKRAETPIFFGIPPIKNPGSYPASIRMCTSILAVEVFP